MCGGGGNFDDSNDVLRRLVRAEQERREQERRLAIVAKALAIQQRAERVSTLFPEGADIRIFLGKLAAYLQMRSGITNWPCDYEQIEFRTLFIEECIEKILVAKNSMEVEEQRGLINENMTAINNLFTEDRISQFKGLFSKNMYDILKTYQDYPKKRKQAIQEVTAIPSAVVDLIGQYDDVLPEPSLRP